MLWQQYALLCVFAAAGLSTVARAAPAPRTEVVATSLLGIGRLGRIGSGQFAVDPIEASRIAGTFVPPHAGDGVALPQGGGMANWAEVPQDKTGVFNQSSFAGGYAYWSVNEPAERVAILEASGHSMVFVNGEPRTGDVYGDGYVRVPVLLRKGENGFLIRPGRGALKLKLLSSVGPELSPDDATLPDLHAGKPVDALGAVVLVNGSRRALIGARITAMLPGGKPVATVVPRIEPLSTRKVGFRMQSPPPAGKAGKTKLHLALSVPGAAAIDLELRVRKPGETYKETFVSGIDGSVQYFAVNPAQPSAGKGRPALVLSLHGASVQAIGQADAYGPKSWATLVAPTNRRPYGYDWEDWGRMDAMEVLGIAQREMGADNARTYLVGHSMGGHGTWQVGALYPDRFAAIAPSAGWISAYSYAGARAQEKPDPIEDIMRRSAATMDTLALAPNYAQEGVYILHGTDDDNVPVTEARKMKDVLSAFHKDFLYHEEPGQGHWWDISDEPGADCVDWAPMWDFLAKHTLPPVNSVRQVDFVTVNPGVSARCRWAVVEAQIHDGRPSEIHISCDPSKRRYNGTTVNVSRLVIDLDALLPGKGVSVDIDGQELSLPAVTGRAIRLARAGDVWGFCPTPPASVKSPARYGPFRAAFNHRFMLVYGTRGNAEENAWAFAKARYDAECWWYRGNGSVDVLPDTVFDTSKDPDRSVILYGNADTNSAWKTLLPESPIEVSRSGVRIGDRSVPGNDLACLFLQPRPASAVACVAAVSGSGIKGMRMTDTLSYLQPMVGYPDVLLLSAGAAVKGQPATVAAGFLGPDWTAAGSDFSWQEGSQ